jgi:hypothetical protein
LGSSITSTTTLYVYNEAGSCSNQHLFKVTIADLNSNPTIIISIVLNTVLPVLPYGDISLKVEQILGIQNAAETS